MNKEEIYIVHWSPNNQIHYITKNYRAAADFAKAWNKLLGWQSKWREAFTGKLQKFVVKTYKTNTILDD